MNIVTLETSRTEYKASEAARRTLTVGELIQMLKQFDEDSPVVFSNDNGYTYGNVSWNTADEIVPEEDEV